MAKGGPVQEGGVEDMGGEHKTYRMVFLAKAGPRTCPVEGFLAGWRRRHLCRCNSGIGMSMTP